MSLETLRSYSFVEKFVSEYWEVDVNPHPFRHVPKELKVSDGDDSEVFLIPETNQVMKFYTRPLWREFNTYEQLQFYKDITNKVSSIAIASDWNISFEKSGVKTRIRINPYDDLIENQELGFVVGVCPFIKGPNLLEEIDNLKLTKGLFPFEVFDWLPSINSQIEKASLVEGVDVFFMNMKLVEDDQGLTLVITDLCRKISELKKALLT